MAPDRSSATAAVSSPRPTASVFWGRARRVAWWSIAVGLALEVTLLALAALTQRLPDWAHVAADTVQKGSWSLLVCAGVSCGLAAHRARPALMGLMGLVSGPVAFMAARSLHKGVLQALTDAPSASGASVLTPALLKGAEYAAFGAVLGWISQRPQSTLRTYLVGGLCVGIVFGCVFILRDRPPFPDVILRAVGELFFPVGCAFVLYVANRIVKQGAA